jgi:hypothetical protein
MLRIRGRFGKDRSSMLLDTPVDGIADFRHLYQEDVETLFNYDFILILSLTFGVSS